jgi:hypothetical protein
MAFDDYIQLSSALRTADNFLDSYDTITDYQGLHKAEDVRVLIATELGSVNGHVEALTSQGKSVLISTTYY